MSVVNWPSIVLTSLLLWVALVTKPSSRLRVGKLVIFKFLQVIISHNRWCFRSNPRSGSRSYGGVHRGHVGTMPTTFRRVPWNQSDRHKDYKQGELNMISLATVRHGLHHRAKLIMALLDFPINLAYLWFNFISANIIIYYWGLLPGHTHAANLY